MQLVQREWLDGGHRFSLRHNHATSAPEKEKAPMFLLFLDAVWQVRVCDNTKYITYSIPSDMLLLTYLLHLFV